MVTLTSCDDDDDDGEDERVRGEENIESTDVERARQRALEAKRIGNDLFARGDVRGASDAYARALTSLGDFDDDDDVGKNAALNDQIEKPSRKEGGNDKELHALIAVTRANRAACRLKLGDFQGAKTDAERAIALDETYAKAYARRGAANEGLENYEGALEDFQKVQTLAPGDAGARAACARLTPIVEKKREEMKEEVMETMKSLGNSLLGNFGLSLDNFKAEKDPNTGSYSINFVQDAGRATKS